MSEELQQVSTIFSFLHRVRRFIYFTLLGWIDPTFDCDVEGCCTVKYIPGMLSTEDSPNCKYCNHSMDEHSCDNCEQTSGACGCYDCNTFCQECSMLKQDPWCGKWKSCSEIEDIENQIGDVTDSMEAEKV